MGIARVRISNVLEGAILEKASKKEHFGWDPAFLPFASHSEISSFTFKGTREAIIWCAQEYSGEMLFMHSSLHPLSTLSKCKRIMLLFSLG